MINTNVTYSLYCRSCPGNSHDLYLPSIRVPHGSQCVMSGLIHTGLGSSSLIAHDLHSPPPPREHLCNRSCSNTTHTHHSKTHTFQNSCSGSRWPGVKRICEYLLNQFARRCPGTGRSLPPSHASLRPWLFPLCTSHASQMIYDGSESPKYNFKYHFNFHH